MSDRRIRIEVVADVNRDDDDIEHLVTEAVVLALLKLVDEYHLLSFEDPNVLVDGL